MQKIGMSIEGDRSFFVELASEAARLDRSPSWLLGHCLGVTLPKIASSVVAAPDVGRGEESSTRSKLTFFVPIDLVASSRQLAARLGISTADILAWAWQAARDDVRAMPSS